jgi:TatD DNase family protein
MRFIDAHCHIDLYDNPIKELAKAEAAQIGVLAVTNAPFVFKACHQLVSNMQNVWIAVGLHPELVGKYYKQSHELVKHLRETRFIGEVGLDYRATDPTTHKIQREVFGQLIEACNKKGDVVLTIHSRGAEADVVSMIGELSRVTTILHWYSGALKHLEIAQRQGSYFSVNLAMLASKNGLNLVKRIDKSRVLTESDGPFALNKGNRTSPEDMPRTIKSLADLWGDDPESVRKIISDNWTNILNKWHNI